MICKGKTGIFFQFPSVVINNISLFEVQDFFLFIYTSYPDEGTVKTDN